MNIHGRIGTFCEKCRQPMCICNIKAEKIYTKTQIVEMIERLRIGLGLYWLLQE